MDKDLAVVQRAKISITFKFNQGAVAALKLPTFANVWLPGPSSLEGEFWCTQEAEAYVLMYPRHFLEKDGFVCVQFLDEIRKRNNEMFGIFGPPKDWGDQRCHLLFEAEYAKKNFQVTDWEIKEWTKKTLLKI